MFSLNISCIKQLLIKNNCGNVRIHFLWFRMNLSVLDQARRTIPKQYVRLWERPGAVLSAQKAGSGLSEPWGQGRSVTEAHERLAGSSSLPPPFPGRESASSSAESVVMFFLPRTQQDGQDPGKRRGTDQCALHLRCRGRPGGQAAAHPGRRAGRQAAGSTAFRGPIREG